MIEFYNYNIKLDTRVKFNCDYVNDNLHLKCKHRKLNRYRSRVIVRYICHAGAIRKLRLYSKFLGMN